MGDLRVLVTVLVFLGALSVFTSGISGVDEGGVVQQTNVSDTPCSTLGENSSAGEAINCGTSSIGNFLELTSLSSSNPYLNAMYIVAGAVVLLYVIVYVVIPLAEAIIPL
jgi:hypothetical protein